MKPFVLVCTFIASVSVAQAADSGAPVTQEQFKQWTDWAKKSIGVLDSREKKLEADKKSSSSKNGEVDLTTLNGTSQVPEEGLLGGNKPMHMETYFDLNLVNQPGTYDALAFDQYHSLLLFDLFPTPDLQFSFNLLGPQTMPLFYELDYHSSKKMTWRAGKIWIPFDDLSEHSPHNIFGGRVGLQQLMPTTTGNDGDTFLPSIWTELGVGMKYMLIDETQLQVETHMTITNGFANGGSDPVVPGTDGPKFHTYTPEPSVSGAGSNTAHRNKAIALRAHALAAGRFGLGISYYRSQWNPDTANPGHLFLHMVGMDGQMNVAGLELRAGFASMKVEYPESTASRGGTYFEAGLPLGSKWKLRGRAGTLQLDDRISQATDMTVVGGTLLFTPGPVQFSLEHNRDVKDAGVPKGFTSYTALRMIMML